MKAIVPTNVGRRAVTFCLVGAGGAQSKKPLRLKARRRADEPVAAAPEPPARNGLPFWVTAYPSGCPRNAPRRLIGGASASQSGCGATGTCRAPRSAYRRSPIMGRARFPQKRYPNHFIGTASPCATADAVRYLFRLPHADGSMKRGAKLSDFRKIA